jgi:hypothetical protein
MRFIEADLAKLAGNEYIAITTNGTVKKSGEANMGKGNAKAVAAKMPHLAAKLGALIAEKGNHAHYLGDMVFSFPVEDSWLSYASIALVEQSAAELAVLVEEMGIEKITMPMPGCGKGGLRKTNVLPVLEKYFDNRFVIADFPS